MEVFGLLFSLAVWIAFSVGVGALAGSKNRSSVGWFFLALLLSPLFMLVLVAVMPALKAPVSEAEVDTPEPVTKAMLPSLIAPELEKLGDLRDRGLLTDDEFLNLKRRLLGGQASTLSPVIVERTAKEYVALLTSAGCTVHRADNGGWEVTDRSGASKVVSSIEALRVVAERAEGRNK